MSADRPATLLEAERLDQGLLTKAEAEAVQARIAAFGDPRDGLPSDGDVFAEDPPDRFLAAVRGRRRGVSWGWAALPVAVAALVALALLRPVPEPPGDILLKGDGPTLTVFRDADGGPELLADGAVAAAGDRLQMTLAAPGWSHGVLLSVDGRGEVTLHHRFAEAPTGTVTVGRAYVLDDAPELEAFHLVVGAGPFDLRAVKEAAASPERWRTGPPPPDGGTVVSVVLLKGPR